MHPYGDNTIAIDCAEVRAYGTSADRDPSWVLASTVQPRTLDAFAPSVVLGEMTEWPKVHAWKACVLARVPWVRIPLSPYNPLGVDIQAIRYELLPNPARPGREQR